MPQPPNLHDHTPPGFVVKPFFGVSLPLGRGGIFPTHARVKAVPYNDGSIRSGRVFQINDAPHTLHHDTYSSPGPTYGAGLGYGIRCPFCFACAFAATRNLLPMRLAISSSPEINLKIRGHFPYRIRGGQSPYSINHQTHLGVVSPLIYLILL